MYTFGKGLESLIPKKNQNSSMASDSSKDKKEPIFYIEVEKVKSNPYQPRKEFNQEKLQALANSIKDYGVLQPLLVSRIEKKSGQVEYQLVAGERRLLASRMIGLSQVPVIIREPTEREKLEVSLVENVQRADLNSMEKAEAYKRLHDEFNFMQKDVARLVGKSREAVANTLRLLDLSVEIKEALRQEKISEGHARAILAAKGNQGQKIVFAKVMKDGLNVREAENFVQKLSVWKPVSQTKTSPLLQEEMKKLENNFKEALANQDVYVRVSNGKPRLTVFFKTKKEIETLLTKFRG